MGTGRSETNSHGQEITTDWPHLEAQLGVLEEVVIGLLSQLDVLGGRELFDNEKMTSLYDEVRRFEVGLINTALCQTHGHQQRAARLLGVKPTTLNSKIKRYNIMLPLMKASLGERAKN